MNNDRMFAASIFTTNDYEFVAECTVALQSRKALRKGFPVGLPAFEASFSAIAARGSRRKECLSVGEVRVSSRKNRVASMAEAWRVRLGVP